MGFGESARGEARYLTQNVEPCTLNTKTAIPWGEAAVFVTIRFASHTSQGVNRSARYAAAEWPFVDALPLVCPFIDPLGL